MGYFVTFHWMWFAGAALIGLAMGWIAVVQRGTGLTKRTMQIAAAVLVLAVVLAVLRLLPGRFGFWLDLGLCLLAVYFAGCAVGSWLRERLIWRSAPRA
jgi:Ca2+/Na+ antiporter